MATCLTRLIWSNLRRATSHNFFGHSFLATRESTPSKMSCVPLLRKECITDHMIRHNEKFVDL